MRNPSVKLFASALMMMACISVGNAQQNGPGAVVINPVPVSPLRPPIGSQTGCPVRWGGRLTSPTLGNIDFTANGTGTFQTTSVTSASQPAGNTQSPVSLNASVSTSLGTISWNFSTDAATATSINANQAGADFPATSDIYFTPEATISSQRGVTYKATSEVHLQNTNLTNFGPQVNQTYTLASGPIDFYDEATGQVVFTINATNIVVGAVDPVPVDNANPNGIR
jgi:hypothetical protein